MPPKPQHLITNGARHGRWTVVRAAEDGRLRSYSLCRCDCGAEKLVRGAKLHSGESGGCRPCGSKAAVRAKGMHCESRGRVGEGRSPEFSTWAAMVGRCMYPSAPNYAGYGGRGITVCVQWLGPSGFKCFLRDMGRKPSPAHSIDRVDVNGNYEPGNCRWASPKEQMNNRRCNVHVEFGGERLTVSQWADRVGVTTQAMRHRLRQGWPLNVALTQRSVPRNERWKFQQAGVAARAAAKARGATA